MPVWLAVWLSDVRVKVFLAFTALLAILILLLFVLKPVRPPLIFTHNGHSVYCYAGRRGCWPITEKERRRIEAYRARWYRP